MNLLDRWRPPRMILDRDLAWVLRCAYGPTEQGVVGPGLPLSAERAAALALRFDLAARLIARWPRVQLARWLGEEPSTRLAEVSRQAIASGLRIEAAWSRLVQDTELSGVVLVPLKFAALVACGVIKPGEREVSDLDVLVAPERLESLVRHLLAAGYRPSGGRGYEHHPGALITPEGASLELHRRLPGVVVADHRGAALGELENAGLLSVDERNGRRPGVRLPTPELLVVHAVAHGLVQHGASPKAYPLSRLFADLIDLGAGGDAERADLSASLGRWVPEIDAGEIEALEELCVWLAAGASADSGEEGKCLGLGGGARRLRDHWLAGVLEPAYGEALKLVASVAPSPRGGRSRWRRALRSGWQALALSRSQIDAIYGAPRSRWGYLLRYLARPFDLARRTLRARAARRELDRR